MKVETRKQVDGFTYSLGSYPVEEFSQDEGYTVTKSHESGPFEQRYEFEVAVSIEKLIDLMVRLTSLLPEEVYLILESYPRNANHRRICLTDSMVERENFADVVRDHGSLWQDEGFIAFGAFSYDPPIEIFLNEHKTVVIYTPFEESTEEILSDFGLVRMEHAEPYYMSVEHIHSSVGENRDGSTVPMRERIESELFERFDFYDQTPSTFDVDECDCGDSCAIPVEGMPHEAQIVEESGVMSYRCQVHGRLVVARPGQTRDFEQRFHITAICESDAVDCVREMMRDANARMVRVKELVPIDVSAYDLARCPEAGQVEAGVWRESERLFPDDVS